MDWLLWATALISIVYIVTSSAIASAFRLWLWTKSKVLGTLVACPVCFSAWVGLALGSLYPGLGGVLGSGACAVALLVIWGVLPIGKLQPDQGVLQYEALFRAGMAPDEIVSALANGQAQKWFNTLKGE